MKKITILITLVFFLNSCFFNKEEKELSDKNTKTETLEVSNIKVPVFKEKKVEIKVEDWKLQIWTNVIIKEWRSEFFPKEISVIDWGTIYQNSNVPEYSFVIVKNKELKEIREYYKNEMIKLWWKEILPNIPQVSKEEASKNKLKKNLQKKEYIFLWDLNLENKTLNKKLNIRISDFIPEIIKENLKLEWNFVEFNFSDI